MGLNVNYSLKIISSLVGGVALFNLSHQVFDIGLNGVFVELINWYGQIFFFPIEYINSKANWCIPDWNKNLIVLIVIVCMLNARSISYELQRKFQAAEESLDDAPVFVQIGVGAKIISIWLLGAYDCRYPFSLSPIAVNVMTAIAFIAFVTGALFIPYIRYVVSGAALINSSVIMLYALRLVKSELNRNAEEADGFMRTNINIWSNTYLSASAAFIVFFALNRYVT
ncbi:hypothetical protein [Thioflavicoccus mobilis]|nr:hypothetical protein [Thioflavicoccus mobilis]